MEKPLDFSFVDKAIKQLDKRTARIRKFQEIYLTKEKESLADEIMIKLIRINPNMDVSITKLGAGSVLSICTQAEKGG